MSVHDERELSTRLSGLLDGLEPRPAPVTQVVRRGRGIRMRRWISVAAGLAIIAAGAALIPGFLQTHRVTPMTPLHYKVTVTTLRGSANGGVVGEGTIGTKRWRVVVNRTMSAGCTAQGYVATCGFGDRSGVGPREVILGGVGNGPQFEAGTVGADITRVAIHLSNGTVLSLRPVSAYGLHWIAVAAPLHAITWAVSFVGQSEFQYAIPYNGKGIAQFGAWLRPGQAGLPVANRSVGRPAWHLAVHAGPWGYCATDAGGSACFPVTSRTQLLSGGVVVLTMSCVQPVTSANKPTIGVVAVPTDVKDVLLIFAGGRRLRMASIAVGGIRVVGYAIPAKPKVVRVLEYGASGQLVHSANGTDWC